MHVSVQLLLLLLGLLAAARGNSPAPRFNVSLDVTPSQRWEPVLRKYDAAQLRNYTQQIVSSVVPKWVINVINRLAPILKYLLPQPYRGEIEGICKFLGVKLGEGLLINLAYEASGYCTSIVAQDSRGKIYHGRNMDYTFTDILRSVTVDVQFVSNGQIVYSGTTFLGFVGLWTGQKPNKFSITANERAKGARWKTAIAAFLKRNRSPSWVIRDALREAVDFQVALKKLSYSPITANVYFILGGVKPNEGVIITREPERPIDVWPLKSTKGQWYRVETNYDHWRPPPAWDDRRTPAIRALNATTQKNINLNTMFKVLSSHPVLNKRTIYTTLICAAQPKAYKTVIWKQPKQNNWNFAAINELKEDYIAVPN
ncbi:N-acylethanolamine-hydrolyzing acid amidase-like isoform X1 [Hypanus sabinus]|uniref:N-acylethanolamine-hydrolyzing acid amidase-like isoform X1 n=1 Tax=Hypanus sabinus TaxID=79690 RepID=UPI0028C4B4F5|nr:N-acylethanolamine-hydrolyzing acid amidase-like isoform X1 [Hypanus sabinus]